MTSDKVCPFMSKPAQSDVMNGLVVVYSIGELLPIQCLGERCVAWGFKIEVHPNCPDGDWVMGCRLIP